MPRPIIAVSCIALAIGLGACGADKESTQGRDPGEDGATVTTNPTPAAGTSTESEKAKSNDIVTVTMKNIKFVPHDTQVKVGQKVTWENNDAVAHNVTATKGADFRSDTLGQGATFDYTPTKPGTIEYVCTIHPGQDGRLIVTK